MKSQVIQNWRLPPTGLHFFIVVILVLGIFFRFANLDRKLYWYDETVTSVRIAGYTRPEVWKIFDGQVINVEDLQKYLHTNPEKGLIDTIKSLVIEDSQHPPLYYVMARFWVEWFGNSVAVTRSLSALISLLVFPCIYWLCLELFGSPLTGWVAIAVIAISPFHLLYAQEAREYVLWTVTILLSSASLLRAIRLNTKLSWGMYAVTVALGLYSFLFSGLVMIGHGIYVFTTESLRLSKTVTAYLLASLAGLLFYAPWLWVIVIGFTRLQSTTSWITNAEVSPLSLVKILLVNLTKVFFDFNIIRYFPNSQIPRFGEYLLTVPVLFLIGYSIYFLCRKTNPKVCFFILTLIGVTAIALILPDIILGGKRAIITRYLIPCYLGIQLAVAYLLTTQITFISNTIWKQKVWQFFMITLVSAGLLSCTIISQAQVTSKTGSSDYDNYRVARIVNQAKRPLLISSNYSLNTTRLLSLSYLLEPKVQLQVVIEPNIPQIADGYSDVFLYYPSETLLHGIDKKQNYKIEPVDNFHNTLLRRVLK